MKTRTMMLVMLVALVTTSLLPGQALAKRGYILQDEFAGLLFERLELVKEDVMTTKKQRIDALEELMLAPDNGYTVGEKLTLHQLVQVLVRVYSLEDNISKPYDHDEALDLLIKKGILEETDKLEVYVLYIKAVIILQGVPSTASNTGKVPLSGRIPRPPASPID